MVNGITTVRVPLRICLAGGGSDLPAHFRRGGGFVVSAAIDKYLTVQVWTCTQGVCSCIGRGPAVALGYCRAAGLHPNQRASVTSDLPGRSGLGGSGALMVGLLLAQHPDLPRPELAAAAYNLERYAVGAACGIQDHYIASLGHCVTMKISRDGNVTHWHNELPLGFQKTLLLMATGIQRDADAVLAKQADGIGSNLVCRTSMERLHRLGREIYDDLCDYGGRDYGPLTDWHWQFKKATSPATTTPQIDQWYELAKANGATGGKVVGAGGGGFMLFVVPPERREHLVATMTAAGLKETPFKFVHDRAEVVP